MRYFRKLFFPFSIIYWFITFCRNFFYDKGYFKSTSFDIPVIAVGNLSMGGTGKTPQIEYLIRLLSDKYTVAVLSRGYKRKSKGFILADQNSTATVLGDEPFQYFKKFPKIRVAVDSNRKNGIQNLLYLAEKPQVILLDDAFQHRRVKAGFYVLLTTFNDVYADDFVLPVGNLRESRAGARRADIVVVTKCPEDLDLKKQHEIQEKLKLNSTQKLFFSTIAYDDFASSENQKIDITVLKSMFKLIVAGIAKPKPFIDFIKNENDEVLIFADHHHFSEQDVANIVEKSMDKIIVTTEKDYVRLQEKISGDNLFYLPIKTKIIVNQIGFDEVFTGFVQHFQTKNVMD